jgi:anti-sigma-K factor RskA
MRWRRSADTTTARNPNPYQRVCQAWRSAFQVLVVVVVVVVSYRLTQSTRRRKPAATDMGDRSAVEAFDPDTGEIVEGANIPVYSTVRTGVRALAMVARAIS